jgi:hypothetical protein
MPAVHASPACAGFAHTLALHTSSPRHVLVLAHEAPSAPGLTQTPLTHGSWLIQSPL